MECQSCFCVKSDFPNFCSLDYECSPWSELLLFCSPWLFHSESTGAWFCEVGDHAEFAAPMDICYGPVEAHSAVSVIKGAIRVGIGLPFFVLAQGIRVSPMIG